MEPENYKKKSESIQIINSNSPNPIKINYEENILLIFPCDSERLLPKDLLNKYPNSSFALCFDDLLSGELNEKYYVSDTISLEEFDLILAFYEGSIKHISDGKISHTLEKYGIVDKLETKISHMLLMKVNGIKDNLRSFVNSDIDHLFCSNISDYKDYKMCLNDFPNVVPVQLIVIDNLIIYCSYDNGSLLLDESSGGILNIVEENNIKIVERYTPNRKKLLSVIDDRSKIGREKDLTTVQGDRVNISEYKFTPTYLRHVDKELDKMFEMLVSEDEAIQLISLYKLYRYAWNSTNDMPDVKLKSIPVTRLNLRQNILRTIDNINYYSCEYIKKLNQSHHPNTKYASLNSRRVTVHIGFVRIPITK